MKNLLIKLKKFIISMLSSPAGDISSKRVNGTFLILSGVILGFISAFVPTQSITVQVFSVLIYSGIILLTGGTIAENINIGK